MDLELTREEFITLLEEKNWYECKRVIEEVKEAGFPEDAAELQAELDLHMEDNNNYDPDYTSDGRPL